MKNIMNTILRAFIPAALALAGVNAFAQTVISGVVKDTKGIPVIGAVVLLESDSSVGTTTDMDGRYTLTIPSGTVQPRLKATCIGYADKVISPGKEVVVNFELSDDSELLDEVVVIGYGAMRKSDLTGSVASVKIDEGDASRNSSVTGLLQGRAAGVQVVNSGGAPDAGVSIRIRGTSTFSGNSDPLYVVDGIIINSQSGGETLLTQGGDNEDGDEATNGLMGLNPQDIQSIEILKDASATAIYGALGANGVVLITTKTGSKERPVVNFSAGVDVRTRYKKMDVLSLDEYAQFYKDINAMSIAKTGSPNTNAVSQLNAMFSDKNVWENYKVQGVDWQDMVMRTAVSQRYYFSISGRPKNLAYAFSLGYHNNQGIIDHTGVQLYTGRLNLDRTVSKRFKFGVRMNLSYTDSEMTQSSGSGRMTANTSLVRSMQVFRPYRLPSSDDEEIIDDELRGSPDMWLNKENFINSRREYRFSPNLYAQVQIVPWLNFKSTIGGDYRNSERQKFKSSRLTSDPNGSSGASATWEYFRWNWDNTFNASKKFGAHFIQGTLGSSATVSSTTEQTVESWNIEQYKAGLAGLNSAENMSTSYAESDQRTLSFFIRGIYNYKDRYVLTATYRVDGSSKFQKQNRWSGFPSMAFAWRMNQEQWFKVPVISMLKFRVGWGRTGNQSIKSYQTLSNFAGTKTDSHDFGNEAGYLIGLYPSNLANTLLKWETTEQVNAGIDFGMWQGRFTLTVDAYNKNTFDLLQVKNIASSSGFPTLAVNEGVIRNRGLEFTVTATPVKAGDFEWSFDGNLSLNRNKIISISQNDGKKAIWTTTEKTEDVVYFLGQSIGSGNYINMPANIFMEGYPMGLFYGYKYNGIVPEGGEGIPMSANSEKGKAGQPDYLDLNHNGYLDTDDRTIIGDPNPDFTYGFGTTFSWKGLSLSANFVGTYGNDILNANLPMLYDTNGSRYVHNFLKVAYREAWTPEHQNTPFPQIGQTRSEDLKAFSDFYLEDGSYLRLSNVTLGYDVPLKGKSKIIRGLTLSLSAQNLFIWTKYSGWDPDVNSYGTNVKKMGIDNGAYPSARTFSFDVKFRF